MGLFDFIKSELLEIIEWVESDSDTVLWKFPDKDKEIKYGAQLTVRDSQQAIFVDEGQIADVYDPGRHKLITDNMPILTTIKSWKYGFESPFKVDIYFVSTKQFTDLKWGTPNPVILRDPEFKQVRVKAFGQYFIKIKDPELFFKEFAGTAPILKIGTIEDRLRDVVSPKFAEALAESDVSVLDMVSNYTELGDKIAPSIQEDLDRFGIEITKFQISSTSLPKEVEEFYDKMTNMNMVGDDMDKFTQFQQAEAIEKAAENPAGGAGEGIGIGVGLGMAKMFMDKQGGGGDKSEKNEKSDSEEKKEAAEPTKEEVIKLLKELGELKEAGILTEEEFNSKKKELLAKI